MFIGGPNSDILSLLPELLNFVKNFKLQKGFYIFENVAQLTKRDKLGMNDVIKAPL